MRDIKDMLEPCPFCGSTKLKMDKKSSLEGYLAGIWRVERHTYSVRCNVCHARGGSVGGKVVPYKPVEDFDFSKQCTIEEELKMKAVEAWNKRILN